MALREASPDAALKALRAFGLSYPGAHTKSPWPGHLDLAVHDKTFAYLSVEGDPFSISCKLPHSADDALSLPFVTPTAYGLGKSGWVTAQPAGPVPVELFKAWIDESYRAQAPKRLVAALAAQGGVGAAAATSPTRGAASPARGARAKKRMAKTPAGKKAAAKSRGAQARAPRAPAKKSRSAAKPAVRSRGTR